MIDRKSLREIAFIVLISIAGTFLFSYVAYVVTRDTFPPSFLQIWNHWDTHHYLHIAQGGYHGTGDRTYLIAFLPLYPLLIKIFSFLLNGNYILSALVVSNISYAVAAYYLYKIVVLDYSRSIAVRAVIFFSIFPTAYFLHAGYTESLFLALTISSFYYGRRGRWFLAGFIGMFATATRITGVVLPVALVVEYLEQKKFNIKDIRKDFFWLFLTSIGLISYLMINYLSFGDPLKFLEFQKVKWTKSLAFPLNGMLVALYSGLGKNPSFSMITGWSEFIFGAGALVLTFWMAFRFRISYTVFMFLTWICITSTSFWLSIPRYSLTMFPVFIAFALFGENKEIHYLITFLSLLFLSLYLSIFIQGSWAF